MSRTSFLMLGSTQGQLNVVGDKLRADGWYGFSDGLHTFAIYLNNFQGRIIIEASLVNDPNEDDWFPIELSPGKFYLQFPESPVVIRPRNEEGETATIGFNLIGNFTWLRARVDRSYMTLIETNELSIRDLGYVDRILLNH